MRFSLRNSWNLAASVWQRLGVRGAAAYVLYERLLPVVRVGPWRKLRQADSATYNLYVRDVPYPLLCRVGTSDRWAFGQVFLREDYRVLQLDLNPRLIVDCGANVGYTSVYFLAQFPHAQVIAIEADERNLDVLQRNLAPYGEHAHVIHAALWSEQTKLRLCRAKEATRGEWGSWVRECQPGESPDVAGVDLQTVLDDSGFDHIDILKMDIEGSEAAVLSKNYSAWIDKVGVFLIELHGPECTEVLRRALQGGSYAFCQRGEVTLAKRVADKGQ